MSEHQEAGSELAGLSVYRARSRLRAVAGPVLLHAYTAELQKPGPRPSLLLLLERELARRARVTRRARQAPIR